MTARRRRCKEEEIFKLGDLLGSNFWILAEQWLTLPNRVQEWKKGNRRFLITAWRRKKKMRDWLLRKRKSRLRNSYLILTIKLSMEKSSRKQRRWSALTIPWNICRQDRERLQMLWELSNLLLNNQINLQWQQQISIVLERCWAEELSVKLT